MISRRRLLQASVSLALIPVLAPVSAATALRTRPSWPTFRRSGLYPVFLDTVRRMRANKDSSTPASWSYWADVHMSQCPHGKPYFLAWHRGFLQRFEAQLRTLSGNGRLVLPYWDYYRDPRLPVEFTTPGSPLYRSTRIGTDVSTALSLSAFDASVVNFQRGKPYAFETAIEALPHNPVHSLIGGAMANITVSPLDPIFWLHHANIDRLWAAWVRAGGGRRMPAATNPYWSGDFAYGAAVPRVARAKTYSTDRLGYQYDNQKLPVRLAASGTQGTLAMQASIAQPLAPQGVSLGGAADVVLGPHSSSVRVPLAPADRDRVRSLLTRAALPEETDAGVLRVVFDGVRLTTAGARGGYFYKIVLNLPPDGLAQPEATYLLGTLGPFEISVAQHTRMMRTDGNAMAPAAGPLRMALPATEVLRRIWPQPLDALSVGFVRVDGEHAPAGPVITIDQLRVEADR